MAAAGDKRENGRQANRQSGATPGRPSRQPGQRRGRPAPHAPPPFRAQLVRAYRQAVKHIKAFNTKDSSEEKMTELESAMAALEQCLAIQPSNHFLLTQLTICRGMHDEMLRTRGAPRSPLPMIIDPNWRT